MTRPRVLFVGPTRYSLPLPVWLARKFDALSDELDWRVLARGEGSDPRFELVGRLFYARLPLLVRREVRRFRPDAVVFEDPFVAGLTALRGPRSIVEVHGNWRNASRMYGSPARRFVAPLADALARRALARADEARALSAYTASLVEEVRGAPPAGTFPTYGDLGAFTARPRAQLPARPTALFVGALERVKGIDVLAAAWPRVLASVPTAHLLVVGRGRLAPPSSAEHREQVSPEEVAALLDGSTVLVLPSRSEGYGRVIVEAFARGRPVVATRIGGIPELVEDGINGLMIEPNDPEALASELVRVLGDSQLALRLAARAAESFSSLGTTPQEFAVRLRAVVEAALH